jgi:hypothetical protein
MTDLETVHARPLPKRPDNGLLAWQATLGYISAHYSLDAMLTIQVCPQGLGILNWTAKASWGHYSEEMRNCPSLPAVLRKLWTEVDRNNIIFETAEAITRRPVLYDDNEWLDEDTRLTLDRLIQLNWTLFGSDWMLIIVYQPVGIPNMRLQARLLALNNTVQISGCGPTMRDACHDLYRNAARNYSAGVGKALDANV